MKNRTGLKDREERRTRDKSVKGRNVKGTEVGEVVEDTALDMYFIAIYICVGGVAYFLFTLLKSFITQGVV